MMKLGQLQTAITSAQPGSSENKKTVFQLGAHVFSKCSPAYTYVSLVSLDFFFWGGGGYHKTTVAKLAYDRRMKFADHIPNKTFIKMH
jgi:hypothetical protein